MSAMDDMEEIKFTEEDNQEWEKTQRAQGYIEKAKCALSATAREGFVSTTGIVGGCFIASEVAPFVSTAALTYMFPAAAAAPAVIARTVTSAATVIGYTVGNKACKGVAGLGLELAGQGVNYLLGDSKTVEPTEGAALKLV